MPPRGSGAGSFGLRTHGTSPIARVGCVVGPHGSSTKVQYRFHFGRPARALCLAVAMAGLSVAISAPARATRFSYDFGAACTAITVSGRTITCSDGQRIAIDSTVTPSCSQFALARAAELRPRLRDAECHRPVVAAGGRRARYVALARGIRSSWSTTPTTATTSRAGER